MNDVLVNGTTQEHLALTDYSEWGGDRHGYFEDFFKVWSDHKIADLEQRLKEAEAVIGFYKKESHYEYLNDGNFNCLVTVDKGKRARDYLAKHGGGREK